MKHCPSCGQDKPLDQFGKNNATKDGKERRCKICKNARNRAIHQADPGAWNAKQHEYYLRSADDRREKRRAKYREKVSTERARPSLIFWSSLAEKMNLRRQGRPRKIF